MRCSTFARAALDEIEARRLLLQAFAGECLDRLNAGALRDYAETIVQARLLTLGDPASSEAERNREDRERNWQEVG